MESDNGGQILQDIFWLQKYDFYWEKYEEILEGFEVAGEMWPELVYVLIGFLDTININSLRKREEG